MTMTRTIERDESSGPPSRTSSFPRDEWYGIVQSKRVGRRPLGLRRLGQRLVLWRQSDGRLVAQGADCPHRGADLSLGRVVDGCLECPWHGLRFDSSGACTLAPAEGRDYRPAAGMRAPGYTVVERHGIVWLWNGPAEDPASLPPIPWFCELPARPMDACSAMVWSVPFARSAEAMLDMSHAPFTHRRALPWLAPRMFDTKTERDGKLIRISTTYGTDKGGKSTEALRSSVLFPGLMLGEFFPRMKLVVALSPIDDNSTHVINGYFVQSPLAKLKGRLQLLFDRFFITPDDLRMMSSASPRHFATSDFHYLPSDAAMLKWHTIARETQGHGVVAQRTIRSRAGAAEPASGAVSAGGRER